MWLKGGYLFGIYKKNLASWRCKCHEKRGRVPGTCINVCPFYFMTEEFCEESPTVKSCIPGWWCGEGAVHRPHRLGKGDPALSKVRDQGEQVLNSSSLLAVPYPTCAYVSCCLCKIPEISSETDSVTYKTLFRQLLSGRYLQWWICFRFVVFAIHIGT